MPSSTGSRKSKPMARPLSDAGSYKLVPQGDGSPTSPMASMNNGLAGLADAGCDWPVHRLANGRLAPSSYVESLLGDATRTAGAAQSREPYSAQDFLESNAMQALSIIIILANAIVIGYETDRPDMCRWDIIENLFLGAFTIELTMKLTIMGPSTFFKCRNNPDITWNVFDFSIVAVGIFNMLIELVGKTGNGKDATIFRMIRLLRILRVLRIIRIVRFLKQLYLLAYGFMEGTMAVFWVTLLASFGLYICSVILVRTYGRTTEADDENWEFFRDHFGNIPTTMFNLFELLACPDLVPYRSIMFQYPPLVVFLITFIILGSFGINGLLVALINESILEKNQARLEADRMEREAKRKLMQVSCREVFDSIDVNGNRVLPRNEIMKCKPQIMQLFEESGALVRSHDLDQMFYIMDFNDTGIIERGEFVQGVVELCDQIRPMSIMELHCQVSKCALKIEACDNKMEGLAKSMEYIEAQEEERLKMADALVDRLQETADKWQSVTTQQEQKYVAVPTINKPPAASTHVVSPSASSGSRATALLPSQALGVPSGVPSSTFGQFLETAACSSSSGSSHRARLQPLLEAEQLRLTEASSLVSALLRHGKGAHVHTPSEVATLRAALFRLQRQTSILLEALFPQPSESQQDGSNASLRETSDNKASTRSVPESGKWGSRVPLG